MKRVTSEESNVLRYLFGYHTITAAWFPRVFVPLRRNAAGVGTVVTVMTKVEDTRSANIRE